MDKFTRRDFLGLSFKTGAATMVAGMASPFAGSVLGLGGIAEAATSKITPFTFAVITDSHLFNIRDHKFDGILADAVATVNSMNPRPDFVIYAGDLAQFGRDEELAKGKKILDKLKVPLHIIPGEHDWYLTMGKGWTGMFGADHWSFDHKGVHFVGLNSIIVPDYWSMKGLTPDERMGYMTELECSRCGPFGVATEQLDFLSNDVKNLSPETPVVIFTHSPLWDYYPRWNFQTSDAPEIRGILRKFDKVMAIHGHVHQVVYNQIGNIVSAGLMSTSWPWPYPPVQLPYPLIKLNRLDPADIRDGMGTHAVSIAEGFGGVMHYRAFSPGALPDNVARGVTM
ncbi:MAG TPA: metallophosphoesterase [Terriglobales bacterium]|nr:metallophosphoesterase [Terriglobales bacterium]